VICQLSDRKHRAEGLGEGTFVEAAPEQTQINGDWDAQRGGQTGPPRTGQHSTHEDTNTPLVPREPKWFGRRSGLGLFRLYYRFLTSVSPSG